MWSVINNPKIVQDDSNPCRTGIVVGDKIVVLKSADDSDDDDEGGSSGSRAKVLYMDANLLNAGGVYPVDADDYTTAVIPAEATFIDLETFENLPNIDTVIIKGNCGFEFYTEYDSVSKASTQYNPFTYAGLPIRKLIVESRETEFPGSLFTKYGINFTAKLSCNEIGSYAFNNCTNLREVDFTGTSGIIGANAFAGCRRIKSIVLPEGITGIDGGAFRNCAQLENVTLPDSLTYTNNAVFSGCGIREIVIPKGLTVINESMFSSCTSLSSVTLHDELKTIADYAFDNCTSLASITIPASVIEIGSNGYKVFPEATLIRGYVGSAAETYASTWGNPFEAIT